MRRRATGDDGAVLVEFALLAPILFLIVFGIIEFGWTFYLNLDVHHGAREGARLAAVNYNPTQTFGDPQTQQIIAEACRRMDASGGNTTVTINHPDGTATGLKALVTVSKPDQSLTHYLDWALPATLHSTVEIRLEQDATWNAGTGTC